MKRVLNQLLRRKPKSQTVFVVCAVDDRGRIRHCAAFMDEKEAQANYRETAQTYPKPNAVSFTSRKIKP